MLWHILRNYNLIDTNVTKAMCLCVHAHVCLHVFEHTCVSVGVHVCSRTWPEVTVNVFPDCSLLYVLSGSLSPNMELADPSPARWLAPGFPCLCLPSAGTSGSHHSCLFLNDVWGSEIQSPLVGQALTNLHGPHLNTLNFSICNKLENYWFKPSFWTLAEGWNWLGCLHPSYLNATTVDKKTRN